MYTHNYMISKFPNFVWHAVLLQVFFVRAEKALQFCLTYYKLCVLCSPAADVLFFATNTCLGWFDRLT